MTVVLSAVIAMTAPRSKWVLNNWGVAAIPVANMRIRAWHSIRQQVHHTYAGCAIGDTVPSVDRRPGEGEKPEYPECLRLHKQDAANIMGSRILPPHLTGLVRHTRLTDHAHLLDGSLSALLVAVQCFGLRRTRRGFRHGTCARADPSRRKWPCG